MAKTAVIAEIETDDDGAGGPAIRKMAQPVAVGHAEMIGGDSGEVAEKILAILRDKGLV